MYIDINTTRDEHGTRMVPNPYRIGGTDFSPSMKVGTGTVQDGIRVPGNRYLYSSSRFLLNQIGFQENATKNRKKRAFSSDFKPRRGTKRNQHLNKYITKIFVTYKHSKTYKIGSGLIFRSVYEGSIVVTISFSNVWFLFICFT